VPGGIGIGTVRVLGTVRLLHRHVPQERDGEGYAPGIDCVGERTCGGLNEGSGRWNERLCWLWLDPLPWPPHGLEAITPEKGWPKRSQHLRHGCDGS